MKNSDQEIKQPPKQQEPICPVASKMQNGHMLKKINDHLTDSRDTRSLWPLSTIHYATINPSICFFTEVSSRSCDDFLKFFVNRINELRMGINPVLSDPSTTLSCTAVLSHFTPITENYFIDLVDHLKPSGSSTDVIPSVIPDVIPPESNKSLFRNWYYSRSAKTCNCSSSA